MKFDVVMKHETLQARLSRVTWKCPSCGAGQYVMFHSYAHVPLMTMWILKEHGLECEDCNDSYQD